MSFTRRILEGVNSLLDKVVADDTPLSHVSGETLDAELKARVESREKHERRPPEENPIAKIAGAGEALRKKRAELAERRERRIRGEREKRAAADRRAQEEAFRRMKEEARRQGASGAGGAASGARSSRQAGSSSQGAGANRRTGAGFGGLGKKDEVVKAYKTLNLSYGAPFDEVKSAYRKLMRRYHPDLHNQSPKKQKAATELTMQVTQAYNVLEQHLQGGPNKGK